MKSDLAARVVTVSVNPHGGVPKFPVASALLRREGVEGDLQRNLKYHGGPERAVCLYARELLDALRAEGHPIEPGTTGENLLIEGVPWDKVQPGARLKIGAARLEITSFTKPCFKIAASFRDGEFKRMGQKLHPGWSRVYARVLQEGTVRPGDTVELEL